MHNVIAWEFNRRRTALLWWTIGSIVMTLVIIALFPSIRDKAHDMNQVLNQLPPELRGLKTGGAAQIDVGNPLEFLNSQLFYATLPMIWIILAITRGASILGRDEQSHTLELLLARPLARGKLLAAKAAALALEFVVVGGLTLASILLLTPVFDIHLATSKLMIATLYTALFSMSFGYVAFALQAASSLTKRAATAIAVAVGFGGYIITSLSNMTSWLDVPVKFMPYHYFRPADILHGHVPAGLVVYLAGVFIGGSLLAYLGFRRRDIE